jgi:hypothetical protein
MLTQLLVAYAGGMALTIAMEIAKVLKARSLNRIAAQRAMATASRAPSFDSAPRIDHPAPAAANEPEPEPQPQPLRAAG